MIAHHDAPQTRHPVRPDAPAAPPRAGAAACSTRAKTPPAAMVERPGRAARHDRHGRSPGAAASPAPGFAIGALGTAPRRRRVAQRHRPRAPTTTSRASPRWSPWPSCCAATRLPGCACCSSPAAPRRPSRTASARSSPVTARAAARAHPVREPRHGRLAPPGDARGRGADLDGGVRGARGCATCSPSSAERLEIPLERGFRARASTDSVIPSRAGYPIATLVSITDWRSPANYHLPSDIPANLDYGTVADATRLVYEVAAVARRPDAVAATAVRAGRPL